MRIYTKIFIAAFGVATAFSSVYAQETLLLRSPSISEKNLTFVYGGDVWIAERNGANPRRLTISPGVEQNPVFSPDGQKIAFTGNYDGNSDVYVISIEGGDPKRLTYHPSSDVVRGWINNDEVYFSSTRDFQYSLGGRLFSTSLKGGVEKPLLMPEAYQGSPSPDGKHWAYIKNTDPTERERVAFKRYRGGGMPSVWLFNTTTHDVEVIPGERSNDVKPLWMGNGKVYFLSDREKIVNVYQYDPTSKKVTRITDFKDYDVRTLQGHGNQLVFEQAGRIHSLDLNSNKSQAISIQIKADALYKRPHYVQMNKGIRSFGISATGQRALFESRGEIFTVPREQGVARNISNSPGTHERYPAWSPDGKWISYISDAKGGFELVLKDQTGRLEQKNISLGKTHYFFQPTWSPDSKKLFYNDGHLNLYYVDINTQKIVKVDTDALGSHTGRTYNHFQPSWSPDSRWISYIKTLDNGYSAVFIYNLETAKTEQITDGMSDASNPNFGREGKYLYFQASTNVGLSNNGLHMTAAERPSSYQVYTFILSNETPSIFKPNSDEETVKDDSKKEDKKPGDDKKSEENKNVQIDFDKISNRIMALPLPAGYYSLDGSLADQLLYSRNNAIQVFDMKKLENKSLIEGASSFQVSADGKRMLYGSRGSYYIVPAGQKPSSPEMGKLKLDNIEQLVDPVAEWNQIYNEVWALQKEFFYVENMHGADWNAVKSKYAKFLPFINHRSDLSYLLNEMMGEMVVGHNYIYPGDEPSTPNVAVGMLGADFTVNQGYYQISKIFTRLDWNPRLKAPLSEPGLNIKEGEYLVEVDGVAVTSSQNIYSLFDNTVNKPITIKVNTQPSLTGARELVVIPSSIGNEMELRRTDWMESNRRKVDELSKGQIAYIYMQNTGNEGYVNFNRFYFSQTDKKATLIDERNNGGGMVADYVTDLLSREQISFWSIRDGKSFPTPGNGIYGPKAMIINENAGSGGDMMPYMFRFKNLGTLVGRTTMGILVGISGYPPLLDGGRITSPNFGIYDLNGKYIIENEGVAPDVFIEQMPKELLQGRDPQLEKTISILMEEMKSYPYKNVKKPADPNRVR